MGIRVKSAIALTFVFVFIAFISLFAQQGPEGMKPGYTATLQKMPLTSAEKANTATGGCGDYFVSAPGRQPNGDKIAVVTFLFDTVQKDGQKGVTMPMFAVDKLGLRVIKNLDAPRVKILRAGGPIYPWVEISISPEELKRAPCLSGIKALEY